MSDHPTPAPRAPEAERPEGDDDELSPSNWPVKPPINWESRARAAEEELERVRGAWVSTSLRLPPEGKYVLARHTRGTWIDSGDQANVNCVVVKLRRGISMKEREAMGGSDRSRTYRSEDEWENNRVPYCWDEFGPDRFFGQDISHWMEIPALGAAHPTQGEERT